MIYIHNIEKAILTPISFCIYKNQFQTGYAKVKSKTVKLLEEKIWENVFETLGQSVQYSSNHKIKMINWTTLIISTSLYQKIRLIFVKPLRPLPCQQIVCVT